MNKYQKEYNDFQKLFKKMISCPHWKELVERATPKKPIDRKMYNPREKSTPYKACPNCGNIVLKDKCCSNNDCRQALDWSGDDA